MKINQILPILIVLLAVGCTNKSNHKNIENTNSDIAKIFGRKSSFLKGILLPIGTKVDINFHFIDGEKVGNFWSYPIMVELSPGKHTVTAYCSGSHDSHNFSSKQVLEIDVIGGKKYNLLPKFPSIDSCILTLALSPEN